MAICYVYLCAGLSYSLQTCLIWLHTVGRSPVTPEFQISMHNLRRSLSLSESLSLSCYVPFYFTRFAAHFEAHSLFLLSLLVYASFLLAFSHTSLFLQRQQQILCLAQFYFSSLSSCPSFFSWFALQHFIYAIITVFSYNILYIYSF